MKKLLLLFGGLMLLPLATLTAGQSSPPASKTLNDTSSFQVAGAVKLGLSTDSLALRPKKGLTGDDKNTDDIQEFCDRNEGLYYNSATKKCELIDVCSPDNPCSGATPVCEAAGDGINYNCLCNDTSCGAGKTCVGGTCYNCEKGEKCNCSGNQVSDGSGGCYTPNDSCNPNPCSGETPSCSALDETQYSCSCTSSSCGVGKECKDMTCQPCAAGSDCGCNASGKEADGNGGCRCPGMKVASGNSCVCPSCYESDGTWGGCRKTCECVSCPDAQKCVDGACVNCPLGEDCGCFDDDAYSNGSGICEPNDPCANVTCDSSWHCEEGECVADACPSGYEAGKTCGDGYTLETNGTSGGKTCGKCVKIEIECTTQEDCAVGEECMSGGTADSYCKPCGNSQGSLCASYCKQGSNTDCSTPAKVCAEYSYTKCSDYNVPCTNSAQCSDNYCVPSYDSNGVYIPQGSTCRCAGVCIRWK